MYFFKAKDWLKAIKKLLEKSSWIFLTIINDKVKRSQCIKNQKNINNSHSSNEYDQKFVQEERKLKSIVSLCVWLQFSFLTCSTLQNLHFLLSVCIYWWLQNKINLLTASLFYQFTAISKNEAVQKCLFCNNKYLLNINLIKSNKNF